MRLVVLPSGSVRGLFFTPYHSEAVSWTFMYKLNSTEALQ